MGKTALLSGTAVLALSAGTAFAGAAHPALSAKATTGFHAQMPKRDATTLYDQNINDNGIGIISQNFETSFDAYDSQGADDFTVPSGHTWLIKDVVASGTYFNGPGPAESYNVIFYKEAAGPAGTCCKKAAAICLNEPYTDPSGLGSPDVDVSPCNPAAPGGGPKGVKLKSGTYFVSVQANMSFGVGGEWAWNTNNTVTGNASQWQNPGDGFATGCTTYTTTTTCIASGEGGDFSFALLGKDRR
jgi:hypothetical protein